MWTAEGDTISGMSPLRAAWLVALTLVAGTLSSRAWAVMVESDPEARRPSDSQSPQLPKPEQTNDSKEDSPATIQIAPQADAWKGGSDRLAPRHTVGANSQFLAAPAVHPGSVPPLINRTAHSGQVCANSGSRDAWLVCRYAHAPPAGR